MSRYEWERGTIIIPTALWAGFKKTIRDAWNQALDSDLDITERILVAVFAANKGKRGVNWREAITKEVERTEPGAGPATSPFTS
jgi:hypothetical protein